MEIVTKVVALVIVGNQKMKIKELSKYYDEDTKRSATVYRDLTEENAYMVSCTNDSGSSFRTTLVNLQDAEDFAEDWVVNK